MLKSYVGRIFALRKRLNISGSISSKDGHTVQIPRVEFPDNVFVLDETNTKVRILKSDGFAIWIPKHFLLKELTQPQEPELSNVLDALITLTGKLNVPLSDTDQEKISKAIAMARSLLDEHKKKLLKKK